jgi:hypothetical protein
MMLKEAVQVVRDVLSPRTALLARLESTRARQAEAGAARQRALDKAEAEATKIRAILERPAQLRNEAFAAGFRETTEVAVMENELRAAKPRELVRFEAHIARLFQVLRASPAPTSIEGRNWVTDEKRVLNEDELERHARLGPLFARLHLAIRDELWRLPDSELSARLAALQSELDNAIADTVLEASAT